MPNMIRLLLRELVQNALYKKGQSRLHLLRRLRSLRCRTLLRTFYDSVVASVIFYAVVCWSCGSSERDRTKRVWITHFLTDRRQYVRLGKTVSDSVTISTGSPQGCVLSPLLFSLYTNCCTSSHQSVKLIKFADDTTLIGLISNGDETAYRREVARLVSWCGHNNLQLNAQKTESYSPLPPLALMDSPVTITDSFRFLGTTITRDLKWEPTISSLIKKAQQRMFFLRQLRKLKPPPRMLAQFYTAIIESILTSSITVVVCWCHRQGQTEAAARRARCREGDRLQASIHPGLYISRTRRCAGRITADPSHPGHGLFSPSPQAGDYGPFGPEPPATLTASSPLPSGC
ncbi:putative RNA-directed DNA polymerase from transposon BS [Takifugu flavidus]|uniref:Putative RNA-directed DNA polymerase from transposon BS n=1 Tax=Takifugu flavidus TaxID=433684 RepID=A0A5C6PRC7_9TELE|nr:putative RNA-directed DNA polymerase from transposon BS [Takifugu flavidus]